MFVAELNMNRPCSVLVLAALSLAERRKKGSDRSCRSVYCHCAAASCSPLQFRIIASGSHAGCCWTYFIIICEKKNIYLQGNLDFIPSSCELCWKPHGQPDSGTELIVTCMPPACSKHKPCRTSSHQSYNALNLKSQMSGL